MYTFNGIECHKKVYYQKDKIMCEKMFSIMNKNWNRLAKKSLCGKTTNHIHKTTKPMSFCFSYPISFVPIMYKTYTLLAWHPKSKVDLHWWLKGWKGQENDFIFYFCGLRCGVYVHIFQPYTLRDLEYMI